MPERKQLLATVGCWDGAAICTREVSEEYGRTLTQLALGYDHSGADGLVVWDFSESDDGHERTIGAIKQAAREIDIPIIAGGRIRRLEDVKKYLYAGAKAVFLDASDEEHIDLIKEAASRFGSEKVYVYLRNAALLARVEEFMQLGASLMILDLAAYTEYSEAVGSEAYRASEGTFYLVCTDAAVRQVAACLASERTAGVILPEQMAPGAQSLDFAALKQELLQEGLPMDVLASSVAWADFKTNEAGLVPVIVQDYKTSEVLMLAYMNEQAFYDTLRTGQMHYYSRSRRSQWLKGETSGHFQYVKSLQLDCDNDTLLAKVHQIGAACHTGSRSCFYQTLAQKPYRESNPLKVFEDVFAVILDRKEHPKEGSYTNYLFDKGIDKILKKVGEEATEIVIAAKNPDPEEIKYEISDFLYHVMVLMAEKGVTWEEIMEELANR